MLAILEGRRRLCRLLQYRKAMTGHRRLDGAFGIFVGALVVTQPMRARLLRLIRSCWNSSGK